MATAAAIALPIFLEEEYVLTFADIQVNFDRNTVTRGGKNVRLTPSEYELLVYFLMNANRELSRDAILDGVWSYLASPNTRTVDAHVLRLRQKLENDPNDPQFFQTVHRVGYQFSATPARK